MVEIKDNIINKENDAAFNIKDKEYLNSRVC